MSQEAVATPESKRKTINEIYIVRALAILGVITVHSTSTPTVILSRDSILYPVYHFMNIFFKFGTPTFIFLSAFVLFYSYYDRGLTKSRMGRYIKNRFKYIIIPYILFSIIYFVWLRWGTFPTDREMIINFLERLAAGKAYFHLYFVFITIQFYFLFPLLLLIFRAKRSLIAHSIWIGLVIQWTFYMLNNQFGIYRDLPLDIQKGSIAFSYMSHYLAGAFLGIYYLKFLELMKTPFKYLLWALWLLFAGLHIYVYYLNRVHQISWDTKLFELFMSTHTLLSALVLFHFSFWLYRVLPAKLNALLINLGVCSFGVYLLHPVINILYRERMVTDMPLYHFLVVGNWVLALGISWLVVYLFSKWKGSWFIFGQFAKIDPPRGKANPTESSTTKSM